MNTFSKWFFLVRSMGLRYVVFRISYELRRRTGLLKAQYPVAPPRRTWITLASWRSDAPSFFFDSRESLGPMTGVVDALKQQATRIKGDELQFFHGEWKRIDPQDWFTNPSTGYQYDHQKHWTEIPDFDPAFGDIKYVWERARFAFLQPILRADAHTGSDSSEWVFRQIQSWIDLNPVNSGPHYRCSQETSLRIFNWLLALYFYRSSVNLTEERFQLILYSMYWQLRHIRSNINFSRIAVRNNHAITESLALYTAGLLLPFFDEAPEWKSRGRKWFEEEIRYQVYDDGTYLQFSFNYHRVIVQLLTWGIGLAHRHGERFDDDVYARARASLNVLLHCQDPVSGQLPNYGANDGSLFFQWNDQEFRDYRPSLDALHFLLTGASCYPTEYEDRRWFGLERLARPVVQAVRPASGTFSFPRGGLYGYRSDDFLLWINCVNYRDRPSQADNLHIDLWYKGENLLRDGGSFQYNATPMDVDYFFGTASHNTVMIDDYSQMQKGPRFVWFYWTSSPGAGWVTNGALHVFTGVIKAFRFVGTIDHRRQIIYDQHHRTITVVDVISGSDGHRVRQRWHPAPGANGKIRFSTDREDETIVRIDSTGAYSPTYGVKELSPVVEFQTEGSSVTTKIQLL